MSVSDWDDDYARLARATQQVRAASSLSSSRTGGGPSREDQVGSIQSGLQRLSQQLAGLEARGSLGAAEVSRRRALVQGLQRQVGGGGSILGGGGGGLDASSSSSPPSSTLLTTTAALSRQDNMIDELASGVSRLKDQSRLINDEATMQNNLLDGMMNNIDDAESGMANETRRAKQLKEERNLYKLYMIIVALSILLFLLILLGLS